MNRQPSHGFTIMELLIASALASILMIGILFATTQQARQVQRQQKQSSPTELDSIVQLLRRDLMLATACRIKDQQIQLQGYFKLDEKTFSQTQQPAQVIYRLADIDQETWLIRHQQDPTSLTLQDSSANLVCKGITSMQLLAVSLENDQFATDVTTFDTDARKITNQPTNISDKIESAEKSEPQTISDQWTPVPAVLQWIITRPSEQLQAQQNDNDVQEHSVLTFTMVLR